MNSEKVKDIKKVLNTWKIVFHGITNADILTYINELESENERLLGVAKEKIHDIGEMAYNNVIESKQLKDRLAELEKENKDYYDRLNNLQSYIDNHEEIWKGNTKIQLQQFAKWLIEKKMSVREYMGVKYKQGVFSENDINETLKEFLDTTV